MDEIPYSGSSSGAETSGSQWYAGNVVYYRCYSGYELPLGNVSFCTSSGSWVPQNITCLSEWRSCLCEVVLFVKDLCRFPRVSLVESHRDTHSDASRPGWSVSGASGDDHLLVCHYLPLLVSATPPSLFPAPQGVLVELLLTRTCDMLSCDWVPRCLTSPSFLVHVIDHSRESLFLACHRRKYRRMASLPDPYDVLKYRRSSSRNKLIISQLQQDTRDGECMCL